LNEPSKAEATAPAVMIRDAVPSDEEAIGRILRPVIGRGDTYALLSAWTARETLAYWFLPSHQVRVAVSDGDVVGTYYLMANQLGGGATIWQTAATRPTSMQFNFVLESNVRAHFVSRRTRPHRRPRDVAFA
jgi:hypothetical protein